MERKSNQEFHPIGQLIGDIMRNCRQSKDIRLMNIWNIWDGAVGAAIAENAQPAAFKGKLLLVHVTDSPMLQQIRFVKEDIIRQVNAALGDPMIQDIRFKIGPLGK
ncbi:MAG: DUF721 domain-containing protein [Thermodesulfobacteriota bacterium]